MVLLCSQKKKIATITLASGKGKTYTCDLEEYKAGGAGCGLNCPKVLGHACCHLMSTATKGGHDINKFHPYHKTTAYWKEQFLAGGTYPTPPDDEAIMAREADFNTGARMPLVVKAQSGRRRRIKSAKEIAMTSKEKATAGAKRRVVNAASAKPTKRRR
jgi:hypothetical protein